MSILYNHPISSIPVKPAFIYHSNVSGFTYVVSAFRHGVRETRVVDCAPFNMRSLEIGKTNSPMNLHGYVDLMRDRFIGP
jgi:hypothetical protein